MSDSTSGEKKNKETAADQPRAEKLKSLAPLMQLLDQARDVVVKGSHSPSEKIKPPESLGDFDLLSPIGRGGMGVVYEARQRSLDRIVALKILPKSQLPATDSEDAVASPTDRNLVQRFHTEARAAARLHHANIVPVFGFGEADGYFFFVMQRIYGQNLDRWIRDHVCEGAAERIDDDRLANTVARFGFQAALGLAYAHGQGVLHRDVKPANLLIDEDGTLQIADFGVARIEDAEALTRTSDVIGTLRYMSPEQIAGKAVAQSDVYSLGVTLYEIATGKPALNDLSVRQAILLQKKASGPVPLAQCKPSLPLDLRTIIEKAMQPEIRYRYEDAKSLADDLERFLNGFPIRARRLSLFERSARWVRRNQTVSVLATLLFFALGFTALVSILDQRAIRMSYDRVEKARQATSRIAMRADEAIDSVFQRFSVTADATTIDYDARDFSAPAVDLKTPELLRKLIDYYDSLSAESLDQITLKLSPAQVRMHLATIHRHLDNHQDAIVALEDALWEIDPLDRLMRARVYNQIGIAQAMLGSSRQAKQTFEKAYVLLKEMDAPKELHQQNLRQFELARCELLMARRLRPGMGPNSMPPVEAFRDNPWKRSRAMGPGIGMPEIGGDRLQGGNLSGRSSVNGVGLLQRDERDETLLTLSTERLGALLQQNQEHVPTMVLLSCTLRNSMRDVLRARQSEDPNDLWLVETAEWVRQRLQAKMDSGELHGQHAILAYEQVLLLSDFTVFRPMPRDLLRQGLQDCEVAMEQADKLVEDHPNVSAYEVLAIHTTYKCATLMTRMFAEENVPAVERLREIRGLLRRTFRRQSRLLQRTDLAYGYSLWGALFAMRLGDIQMVIGEESSAVNDYRQAMSLVPLQIISELESAASEGELLSQERQTLLELSADNPILIGLSEICQRYAFAERLRDPKMAHRLDAFCDELAQPQFDSWKKVQDATELLINSEATQ
ncbi:serine/threonine protein kinase [Stieleria sp. JC731]|uniref:serine/threonine protein kinase n=1 Tax=Pirellulaceae TaxID=2691357 RepID=UPI001E3B7370|nr:serine/threonine-protein kinase [Stieleria sp. JC731]MCC9599409.1 serine/threonine protein kinase [Stieleria sp. JC731]